MSVDLNRFETALIALEHQVKDSETTSDLVFLRSLDAFEATIKSRAIQFWLRTGQQTTLQFSTQQLSASENDVAVMKVEDHPPGKLLHQGDCLVVGTLICRDTELVAVCEAVTEEIAGDVHSALDAIFECLADFYRRLLLNRVEARIARSDGYAQLFAVIANTFEKSDRHFQIASGVRAMLQADRVTLLQKEGDEFVFESCSNNRTVERQSPLRRLLVEATGELCEKPNTVVELSLQSELPEGLRQLQTSGVAFVSLALSSEENHSYAFLVESFTAPPEDAALELLKAQVPRLSTLASQTAGKRKSSGKRLRNTIVLLCLLLLVGIFYRVPFTIEVRGQAFPAQRVHVFAPADGVIESLEIENESEVMADDLLAVIRNETLRKELQFAQGQLSTEEARLVSMQRSRSSETRTGESARFSEAATQQRITDLKSQLELLELEDARMKIESPCQGIIVRADLKEELLLRPVRRGQSLFEIVSNNGDWQLELDVPDQVSGYVRIAAAQSDTPLDIQYVFREHILESQTSSLEKLDSAVTLKGNEYYCRATAGIDSKLNSKLRPGASVTARINCGRQSIAFVALREVIEFVKEKSFTWW